jgi:hypothetical protein
MGAISDFSLVIFLINTLVDQGRKRVGHIQADLELSSAPELTWKERVAFVSRNSLFPKQEEQDG